MRSAGTNASAHAGGAGRAGHHQFEEQVESLAVRPPTRPTCGTLAGSRPLSRAGGSLVRIPSGSGLSLRRRPAGPVATAGTRPRSGGPRPPRAGRRTAPPAIGAWCATAAAAPAGRAPARAPAAAARPPPPNPDGARPERRRIARDPLEVVVGQPARKTAQPGLTRQSEHGNRAHAFRAAAAVLRRSGHLEADAQLIQRHTAPLRDPFDLAEPVRLAPVVQECDRLGAPAFIEQRMRAPGLAHSCVGQRRRDQDAPDHRAQREPRRAQGGTLVASGQRDACARARWTRRR